MTEEFKEKMGRQIARADEAFLVVYTRVQAEYEKNPNENTNADAEKLEFWLELIALLFQDWGTTIVRSQDGLADACPRVKLGRGGKARKDIRRIVREGIEALRSFGYPILSKSNFSKKLLDIPRNEEAERIFAAKCKSRGVGFWFARSEAEIDEYLKRTDRGTLTFMKTLAVNKKKEHENLGRPSTVYDGNIAACERELQPNVIAMPKVSDPARREDFRVREAGWPGES